ncbi:MAG: radical SAM protein [Deltaproteobacteria bacterium]|nr:radical SAM protein [Deltaproteobacteria bacterium]
MGSNRRVLLIKPLGGREVAFPLDLAGMVPAMRRMGWEVRCADADFQEVTPAIKAAMAGLFDAAVFSVESHQTGDVASIVRRLKTVAPDMPIAITGPHPTLFPVEALTATGADIAVRGDPDLLVAEALENALDGGGCIDGCACGKGDGFEVVGEPVFLSDLDGLDPPDRDLAPLARYGVAYRSVRYPFAAMKSSRGCPCNCPHCAVPAIRPHGFSARSPLLVVEEMESLTADYGIRDIHFEDDAFMADSDRVAELCRLLIDRGFTGSWELVNGVRPEHVETSLLHDMSRAGCRRIAIGVETLRDDARTELISGITAAAGRVSISTTGYFILGYPGASPRDDERLVEASRELGFAMVHYSAYRDVPGSSFFREGADAGYDPGAVRDLVRRAYRGFYMRPGPIAGLIGDWAREPRLVSAVVPKVLSELFGLESSIL